MAGGYAEQVVADARYVFVLPPAYSDEEAAPLLCAGLIGWRAYAMAGKQARRIGLYGFGAAAHLIDAHDDLVALGPELLLDRSRRSPPPGH